MKELRIHARAGQGAITTAMLIGAAIFEENRFALAFPHFGAARMGAPMNAFLRISDKPIRLRSQIYEPDYVIIVDPSLISGFDVLKGLKNNGIVIANEPKDNEERQNLSLKNEQKIFYIPASKISNEMMGMPTMANTVLIGAFSAVTGELKIPTIENVMRKRFGNSELAELNIKAAKAGFTFVDKA